MEKAIEIKRRAQRCILNGDLDGALGEYQKLVASGDSDPYHSVLLADLLYKKGDHEGASRRYLEAVDGYEKVGLFKNAIAVCKKMSRLSLSKAAVIRRLASLHALDGLATESTLHYMQHAELVLRKNDTAEAEKSLRLAFQVCPDNVRALERLSEVQHKIGKLSDAAQTLLEAATHYERLGQLLDARRCQARAEEIKPGSAPPSDAITDRLDLGAAARPSAPAAAPAPAGAPPGARPDSGSIPWESRRAKLSVPRSPEAPPPGLMPGATLDLTPTRSGFGLGAGATEDTKGATPEPPGLSFGAPPSAGADEAPLDEVPEPGGLSDVNTVLNEAQQLFQSGDRQGAGMALMRAAQAFDHLGRFDNAASIYRSLSKVIEPPLQLMMLWLKNCQRRDDVAEAARVACDLGDRALGEGDTAGAREWFERARSFDPDNPTAPRRLQQLGGGSEGAGGLSTDHSAAADDWEPAADTVASTPFTPREGRVEVEYNRDGEIDLGTLITEFQQGVESQLASDPQGYYDLAMTYREMGLLDQAIEYFRTSAQEPRFVVRAAEMIARCQLDQGAYEQAAQGLRAALALPELDRASALDLRYLLGLALEGSELFLEALEEFESVFAVAEGYPDVAVKIRALRKTLELK